MIFFQETVFSEIDLQDFSVAASGIKNDNNSFSVSLIELFHTALCSFLNCESLNKVLWINFLTI